ncbi:MAG: hypothetical protein NT166_29925 [Candidatus Aminicenantes bacterium]|nr:hypothetical protein [Candidatus Aminicenantes bacterium]
MAQLIHALKAYAPRLKISSRASMNQVVNFITGRTGLNRGTISMVLYELQDTLLYFHLTGRSVKLDGLGCYTPFIDTKGNIDVTNRLPAEFKAALNKPHAYEGDIINRDMIGKTSQEIIARWNEEHPDDKINID